MSKQLDPIVENMDEVMRRLFSKNRTPATAEAIERIKQAVMEAVKPIDDKQE